MSPDDLRKIADPAVRCALTGPALAATREIRAQAAAQMHAEGASYARIAAVTGLTRAGAQQLVKRALGR